MRIVYVEDNIANVHLVKRVARMGKHEIINYIDGMDALNNFETDNADLVLMDIQLAGELTGIEVVKKLRDKGFTTPIYAVTAYAMVGDKERCIEAGCTGYMSKPLPIPDLVKLFQMYDKPTASVKPTPTNVAISDSPEATTPKPIIDTVSLEVPAVTEVEKVTADATPVKEPLATEDDKPAKEEETAEQPQADATQVSKSEAEPTKPTSPYNSSITRPSRTTISLKDSIASAESDDSLADEDSVAVVEKKEGEDKPLKPVSTDTPAEMK